jgi:hypothetical protein
MYLNLATQEVIPNEITLRVALRHVSLPLCINEDTLRMFGYTILHEGVKPKPSVYQTVEEDGLTELEGQWAKEWKLVNKTFEDVVANHPRLVEIKEALKVLDERSIRPLRTLVMRKGGKEDYDILLGIEEERDKLMTEMNDLIAVIDLALHS